MATTTDGSQIWSTKSVRQADADGAGDDTFAAERGWPAWRVTLGVVLFCAACWSGIGYIAMRLLS